MIQIWFMSVADRTMQAIDCRFSVVIIAVGLAGIVMFLPSLAAAGRSLSAPISISTYTEDPSGFQKLILK